MIYLDNAATTPIDPRVKEAMMPFLTEQFGNPGSLYKLGRDAKAAVEKAREQVAKFMGAKPEQIIFTSGATEANNMVFEITRPHLVSIGKTHILTSQIEHKSVLRSVRRLIDECGFEATFAGLSRTFSRYPDSLGQSMCDKTGLVSVMYANNEIGHTFDVRHIGLVCSRRGILFHTDCVQAAEYRPLNMEKIGCDFATISAHKLHGPKGIGALFVKDPEMWWSHPMILGGESQEFGMRGGTENVAAIVGFGKACEIIMNERSLAGQDKLEHMKSSFLYEFGNKLDNAGVQWYLNGCSHIATKTLNLRVDGIDAESLILLADSAGVCISAGSACNSREHTPSHVLTSIGLNAEQAKSSFRVSFSRTNTQEEACDAGKIIGECVLTLQGLKYEKA